ncbi:MAG: CopD family protein [Alphaproteobacteria bacterium]|jgi:putative membrane protein|nr:CopD family protein [Alphaproteobacteria bacterium]MBP7729595.1 CopD family protein [Alphaproteobacteria bacterium]
MFAEYYLTLKSLHILAIIAWMAGLLYLPRLFIYHLDFEVGSKAYLTFCTMEKRLLKIIMLPAMLLSFSFGFLLAFTTNSWNAPWFHMKLFLVLCLAAYHGYLSRIAKEFSRGETPVLLKNTSKKMLCLLNEVPFLLAIFIVFLAILKPF